MTFDGTRERILYVKFCRAALTNGTNLGINFGSVEWWCSVTRYKRSWRRCYWSAPVASSSASHPPASSRARNVYNGSCCSPVPCALAPVSCWPPRRCTYYRKCAKVCRITPNWCFPAVFSCSIWSRNAFIIFVEAAITWSRWIIPGTGIRTSEGRYVRWKSYVVRIYEMIL